MAKCAKWDPTPNLMEKQGIYYRLYQLQYEREELKLAAHETARQASSHNWLRARFAQRDFRCRGLSFK